MIKVLVFSFKSDWVTATNGGFGNEYSIVSSVSYVSVIEQICLDFLTRISGEYNMLGILFLVEAVISELISSSSHVSQSEQALATFLAWILLALFKEIFVN